MLDLMDRRQRALDLIVSIVGSAEGPSDLRWTGTEAVSAKQGNARRQGK